MLQVWDTAGQERFRTITTGKIFKGEWFSSTPCDFYLSVLCYSFVNNTLLSIIYTEKTDNSTERNTII